MLPDVAHGGIDHRADVLGFGAVKQVIEPRLGEQIQDALGVVGGEFIKARATPGGRVGLGQRGALGGEADFDEPQEDEAEDWCGVFLGIEAGVGAELVGGLPEAFSQRGVVVVLFGWGDAGHGES